MIIKSGPPLGRAISRSAMLSDALTRFDVDQIVRLVETLHKSNLYFIRLEANGIDITVAKGTVSGQSPATTLHSTDAPLPTPVLSPQVGFFNSQAGLDLRIGSLIEVNSALGSIKTLDETIDVKAVLSGIIADIYVSDGDFVEFGQPLYSIHLVEP